MVKSVLIDDDIHRLLVQKQTEMLSKKIRLNLSEVAGMAIAAGINSIDNNKHVQLQLETH